MVRITTWNVNGIRNPFGYQPWRENRTFNSMFDILQADIVIMQELKIQRKDLTDDMVLVPGWDCYFSLPKHKKGYSGVGIYTRQSVCAPIRAEEGVLGVLCPPGSSTPYRDAPAASAIGGYPSLSQVTELGVDPAGLDAEGRCLVLEFPAFVLFGVYSPANSNGQRHEFRYAFLMSLDARIRNLARMGKKVILTGDLNVNRELIDTAKAEDNMRSEGITYDEFLNMPNRRIFNQLLLNGKVPNDRDEGREEPVLYDLCREFHPDREGMYTHWEQKINARPGNFGSRIDFVLCSISMKDWFQDANIQEGLMGSDHCPVYAVTKDKVLTSGDSDASVEKVEAQEETHILDMMNPPGMFKDGVRQREYSPTKDTPPLSGKLLPEFTKRRNIRDMFSRKPTLPKAEPTPTPMELGSQAQAEAEDSSQTFSDGTDLKSKALAETLSVNSASRTNGHTVQSPSPLNSPEKRRAPSITSPNKIVKRSKSTLSSSATAAKGQQSLKGFFQTRTKSTDTKERISGEPAAATAAEIDPPASQSLLDTSTVPDSPASQAAPVAYDPDPRASQEASRESWTKLFSKKPAPRCEHGEPCITLTTKKPGLNCGRQFWICPRPIGPSGQKEVGTQWRCGTFIWSSDWKGG
ncbi:DNA lyase-like protein [Pyrenochaeta sp. DS3sAY3a]|nr:DNA lyase-like protein [Pyrenochaeta sp. DS3sAY3a]